MSFSSETKIALAREIPERGCCRLSMLSGMLLFSAEKDGTLLLQTEVRQVAGAWETLLARCTETEVCIRKSGGLYKTRLSAQAVQNACRRFSPEKASGRFLPAPAAARPFSAAPFSLQAL